MAVAGSAAPSDHPSHSIAHKVIGVGFQKTGTSSFGLALAQLGYRVASYDQFRDLRETPLERMGEALTERARSLLGSYDAFKDMPWPILYREMDAWLPGSKFVLITRDPRRWIKSVVQDFGAFENPIRRHIYGVGFPVGNESTFLERYERHNAEVCEYFKHRPGDFLHLRLDEGEVTWANLCAFLGHPVPDTPWPHANTADDKRRLMRKLQLWSRLRRLVGLR